MELEKPRPDHTELGVLGSPAGLRGAHSTLDDFLLASRNPEGNSLPSCILIILKSYVSSFNQKMTPSIVDRELREDGGNVGSSLYAGAVGVSRDGAVVGEVHLVHVEVSRGVHGARVPRAVVGRGVEAASHATTTATNPDH